MAEMERIEKGFEEMRKESLKKLEEATKRILKA